MTKFNSLNRDTEKVRDPQKPLFSIYKTKDKCSLVLNSSGCQLLHVWIGDHLEILDIPGAPARYLVKSKSKKGYALKGHNRTKDGEWLNVYWISAPAVRELLKAYSVKGHKQSFYLHRTENEYKGEPVYELLKKPSL